MRGCRYCRTVRCSYVRMTGRLERLKLAPHTLCKLTIHQSGEYRADPVFIQHVCTRITDTLHDLTWFQAFSGDRTGRGPSLQEQQRFYFNQSLESRVMCGTPPRTIRHPPTNQERFTLFENMMRCGVKSTCAKTYLAMYWLDISQPEGRLTSPLFENNPSGHAEDHLLRHLLLQLSIIHADRLKAVTILQNASPCARETGLTVRTICLEDWRMLCTALQVPFPQDIQSPYHYFMSLRGQDDYRLRDDLEIVLS
ncbi:uncharacterized protein LOC143286187 isoform X2 [Babylonia areolata]|uniref:uncharacterized protein LOC143286187 isoform X2 n=1 Tax=Babylonia areolata TaxID=304850 RepID=UPI003FD586BA